MASWSHIETPKESKGKPALARDRVYVVDIDGKERRFQTAGLDEAARPGAERCRQVLLDFREVGVKVLDDDTLQIRLNNPTHYFIDLVGFYPFAPVNQRCLEKYGSPAWTRPENIVTNGAFRLVARRLRDRIRLAHSDNYWDREHVRLHTVDALSVDDRTTGLNMYMTGMVDWITVPPAEVLRILLKSKPPRNDLNPAPQLTTYFYMLNTKRPPLNDKRVRQALSMAMDRDEITRVATGAGEIPAYSLVPPSMPNYHQQRCAPHDPAAARNCWPRPATRTARAFRSSKSCTTRMKAIRRLRNSFANSGSGNWESPRRCGTRNGARIRTRSSK